MSLSFQYLDTSQDELEELMKQTENILQPRQLRPAKPNQTGGIKSYISDLQQTEKNEIQSIAKNSKEQLRKTQNPYQANREWLNQDKQNVDQQKNQEQLVDPDDVKKLKQLQRRYKEYQQKKAVKPVDPELLQFKPEILQPDQQTLYDDLYLPQDLPSPRTSASKGISFRNADEILQEYDRIFQKNDKSVFTGQIGTSVQLIQKNEGDPQVKGPKDDEVLLLAYYFANHLEKSQADNERVEQKQVLQFMRENDEILTVFDKDPQQFQKEIDLFPTEQKGLVNEKQFAKLMLCDNLPFDPNEVTEDDILNPIERRKKRAEKKDKKPEDLKNQLILPPDDYQKILKLFQDLDTFNTKQAPIRFLIQKLLTDEHYQDMLEKPTILLPSIEKEISLNDFLYEYQQFVNDLSKYPQDQDPEISLKEFKNQFENYQKQKIEPRDQVIRDLFLMGKLEQPDYLMASRQFIDFARVKYNDLYPQREEYYVQTHELIQDIVQDPKYQSGFANQQIRDEPFKGKVPIENIKDTLERMQTQAYGYIDFDQFIEYFTMKGRPSGKQVSTHFHQLYDKIFQEEPEDFDPESSVILDKRVKDKKEKRIKEQYPPKGGALIDSDQHQNDPNKQSNKFRANQFKVTIPQPFDFEQREKNRSQSIRQRRLQEMLDEKEEDDMRDVRNQFQANKVPKSSIARDILKQMMAAQKQRREQFHQKQKVLLQMMLKPFSFDIRDSQKQRDFTDPNRYDYDQFKAQPMPSHVKEARLQAIMNDQRQQSLKRLADRQAWLLDDSNLPQAVQNQLNRMREYEEEKQSQLTQKNEERYERKHKNRIKPIPDFESLHKSFDLKLHEARMANKNVEPMPFNIVNESKRTIPRDYLDIDRSEAQLNQRIEQRKKSLQNIQKMRWPPSIPPESNNGLEQMLDMRKTQREAKRSQEKQQINDQKLKEKREKIAKDRLRKQHPELFADSQERKKFDQLNAEFKSAYVQRLEDDYQSILKDIKQRLGERSLLIDRYDCKTDKDDPFKRLMKINNNNKSAQYNPNNKNQDGDEGEEDQEEQEEQDMGDIDENDFLDQIQNDLNNLPDKSFGNISFDRNSDRQNRLQSNQINRSSQKSSDSESSSDDQEGDNDNYNHQKEYLTERKSDSSDDDDDDISFEGESSDLSSGSSSDSD